MNKLLDILAGLIGLALIGFGVFSLADTTAVTAMTALEPKGVAGLNEARAIYAGSFWAMGGLILFALASPRYKVPLLLANGVIFVGFLAARLASIMMDGYDPMLTGAIVSEAIAAAILLAAAKGRRAEPA